MRMRILAAGLILPMLLAMPLASAQAQETAVKSKVNKGLSHWGSARVGATGKSTIDMDAQTYGRLRSGVIAEVGSGRPATVGMVVNPGPQIGLAGGMSFGRLSGDIELSDLRQDIAELKRSSDPVSPGLSHLLDMPVAGNLHTSSVLTHLYYDLPAAGPVTPYLGGGLGVSKLTLSMPGGRSEANVTHYEAVAGVKTSMGFGDVFAELRAGQSSSFSFKAEGAASSKETKEKRKSFLCGITTHF